MGFFSELKEDLNQAVNELLPEDNSEAAQTAVETQETPLENPEAEAVQSTQPEELPPTPEQLAELEVMLQNIEELRITEEPEEEAVPESGSQAPILAAVEEDSLEESVEELQSTVEALQGSLGALKQQSEADGNLEEELRATFGAPVGEETVEDFMHAEAIRTGANVIDKSWVLDLKDLEATDETAIITAGMRLKGDILSNGSIDIIGEVIGNVQVKGKLNVTGKITGNSKAEEVFADSARVTGDIISDGTVKIGAGSVVIGNVEATSAAIAGAVKGTIDVMGPVVLDATAVVLGNIRAKSMQINNGARIEGMCVLCYAEQSAAKFFENQDNM